MGVFKNDVGERVAFGGFLLDFGLKVVVGILGLPVTTIQEVLIAKRSIGPNGAARQFWNKRPAGPPAGLGQQILKRRPQCPLMRYALLLVGFESGVVVLDIFWFWLSSQWSTSQKSRTEWKATVRRSVSCLGKSAPVRSRIVLSPGRSQPLRSERIILAKSGRGATVLILPFWKLIGFFSTSSIPFLRFRRKLTRAQDFS